MTNEEATEYWEGLRKTFSSQLEQEENYFGRMHLQTTIDAIDMEISALRQQDATDKDVGKNEPLTNAQKIRAMTDEELAAFINRIVICHHLRNAGNCEKCPIHPAKPCDTEGIAEWLQQPAEEDDHD